MGTNRLAVLLLAGVLSAACAAPDQVGPRAIAGIPQLSSLSPEGFVHLGSVYSATNCAIDSSAQVHCWGRNVNGQASPPGGAFTRVSSGLHGSCGIRDTGNIACWGIATGNPAMGDGYIDIVVSGRYSCALRESGTLACWEFPSGQPAANPPAGSYTQFDLGDIHGCALRADRTIACWGQNFQNRATPPAGTFTHLAAGSAHTCAVRDDATVACWGFNGNGQTSAPSGSFRQLAGGFGHTCGVRTDGTIACWGNNLSGQATPPSGEFVHVQAGAGHSCALRTDGSIACWGAPNHGATSPPQLNAPPIAFAGADQVLECTSPSGASATLDGSGSSDDHGIASWTWREGATTIGTGAVTLVPLGLGLHSITLTVADAAGLLSDDDVQVTVQDSRSPSIALNVEQRLLWPPNGTMRLVARRVGATDICDTAPAVSVSVSHAGDAQVLPNGDGTFDVWVRAVRDGSGGDRTYTITVVATDASGNTASATDSVTVPHDQGIGSR